MVPPELQVTDFYDNVLQDSKKPLIISIRIPWLCDSSYDRTRHACIRICWHTSYIWEKIHKVLKVENYGLRVEAKNIKYWKRALIIDELQDYAKDWHWNTMVWQFSHFSIYHIPIPLCGHHLLSMQTHHLAAMHAHHLVVLHVCIIVIIGNYSMR